jgi:hypothetical protein
VVSGAGVATGGVLNARTRSQRKLATPSIDRWTRRGMRIGMVAQLAETSA